VTKKHLILLLSLSATTSSVFPQDPIVTPPKPPEFAFVLQEKPAGESWVVSGNLGSSSLLEMYPPQSNPVAWEEKISWSIVLQRKPLEIYVREWINAQKKEDSSLKTKQEEIDTPPPGVLVASESVKNAEMTITRLTQIPEGIMSLSYKVKTPSATQEKLSSWLRIIKGADMRRMDGRMPNSLFLETHTP
jgi:hypothetical protein